MQIVRRNIKKIVIILVILIIITITSIKYYLDTHKAEIDVVEKEEVIEIKKEEKKEDNTEKIYVDIKGAVKNPGVYELDKDTRTNILVSKAGGLTEEADTTYINLAKKLKDEMVVVIYTKDQIKKAKAKDTLAIKEVNNTCICPKITNDVCIAKEDTTTTTSNNKEEKETNNNQKEEKKVNINTATIEELQTLQGVGESKAKAIIEYRETNGKYSKIEDIMNVSGIGESLYEKIKNNITI